MQVCHWSLYTFYILTLKVPAKATSENVICCIYILSLLTNESMEANRVDPDRTALGAVRSGSTLFIEEASKTFQQISRADNFCYDQRFEV